MRVIETLYNFNLVFYVSGRILGVNPKIVLFSIKQLLILVYLYSLLTPARKRRQFRSSNLIIIIISFGLNALLDRSSRGPQRNICFSSYIILLYSVKQFV